MFKRAAVVSLSALAVTGCAPAASTTDAAPAPTLTSSPVSSASESSSESSAGQTASHTATRTITATRTVTHPSVRRTRYVSPSPDTTSASPSTSNSKPPIGTTHTPTVLELTSTSVAAGTYGQVQIAVVVVDGVLTDITMLHQPDSSSHSRDISAGVFPMLIDAALMSQSPDIGIAGVTGASYSYQAFKQALQSIFAQLH